MRILVTGNMGYVGPVVVEHLRRVLPHAELVGLDAGYFGACLTGAVELPESRLDGQIFGDVRDVEASLFAGFDAVVHLAAISNDPIGNLYERVTYEINHEASLRVAELAKRAGVRRFVFASSCSVYGFAEDGARTESSELGPLTPYAKSKVMAEQDLARLAAPGFQVTSLRFPTACGMSPRLRLDLVLNDFAACAQTGQDILVLSDGTPWRPLIDVRDMARGVEWALGREGAANLAINVGHDARNYQIRELAHAVADEYGSVGVSINQDAPPDKRSYRVQFDLYRDGAAAHQPQQDLRSSIRALREGLGAMGFSDREFRKSKLMRLNYLTLLRERGLLDESLRWTHRIAVS